MDDVENYLSKSLGDEIVEGGEAKVYDHGSFLVKSIGLDYFIQPIFALDRISLHNAYFPETTLNVLGFGRDNKKNFKIIVEQPFVEGVHVDDEEIREYMFKMGFKLINPKNWGWYSNFVFKSKVNVFCNITISNVSKGRCVIFYAFSSYL